MKRKVRFLLGSLAASLLLLSGPAAAGDLHVSPDGRDDGDGSLQRPWATIGRAAELAGPGDTVFVHAGVYRETVELEKSGTAEHPIRFVARPGDRVVLSGAEPVTGTWSAYRGRIEKVHCTLPVRQLFADGHALVEARWPNRPPGELWDRSRWASTDVGSRYGKIVDAELAKAGFDATGAIAVLNVAHQFYTWTRTVSRHTAGSDTLEYPTDLTGITHHADKTRPWEDDRYYLFGKLELLDAPGEWHFDAGTETLYLWKPLDQAWDADAVEAKVRDFGFVGRGLEHVEIRGFHFFGCTFSLEDCRHCTVDGCHLLYPSHARRLDEKESREDRVTAAISGSHNTVRWCSFAYGSTSGLKVAGPGHLVENNLIHDFCDNGSLHYPGLTTGGVEPEARATPTVIRHNTVFHCGNAIINFRGPGQIVEYNHVHDGGLACKDVALIYTGLPTTAGNVVRHNWVHGCYTERRLAGGLRGGLGIRGDDQTRELDVHHNVVWDCGRDGIIVKGDRNRVWNNTVFDIGTAERRGNGVDLPVAAEPKKPWRHQWPLLPVQNERSLAANNAAQTITGDHRGTPFSFRENLRGNYQGEDFRLVDPERLDFRPREDSPLVDAGEAMEGLTGRYEGKAPDAGAYEIGAPRGVPGHRNAIWLLPERPAEDGSRRFRMLLAMPIRQRLEVTIAGGRGSRPPFEQPMVLLPSNWMQPVTATFPADGELRLKIPPLGLDVPVDLDRLDPVWGVKLPFCSEP